MATALVDDLAPFSSFPLLFLLQFFSGLLTQEELKGEREEGCVRGFRECRVVSWVPSMSDGSKVV